MAVPPIITLLTDFGIADHYVASMKGVILGICPEARLVDITHQIPAFGISQAAFVLSEAWTSFPKGSIHVVVVDPGVGSARRPLLLEAQGHYFVAPDNGVLTLILNSTARVKVREIAGERYFRKPVSRTFHGRDIFAPVAAHLGRGVRPSRLGKRIADPIRLIIGEAVQDEAGNWVGQVVNVDRFGNLITNLRAAEAGKLANKPFCLQFGNGSTRQYSCDYASVPAGEYFVIEGSSGYLEISLNQGDAAKATGLATGAAVVLRSA